MIDKTEQAIKQLKSSITKFQLILSLTKKW